MEFSPLKLKQNFKESVKDTILKDNLYNATQQAAGKREILRNVNIEDWEKSRIIASEIRKKSLDNNKNLLFQFVEKFEEAGGKILWAKDDVEAVSLIINIVKEVKAKTVVKGKSMVTEEIELNQALEKEGIEVWETDLGEFIVQLEKTKPVHIITPVIHRNRKQIAELFNHQLQLEYTDDPIKLTRFARNFLREKFLKADVGITGANFIIAETGHIVLVSNEGNIRMSSTLPNIHIAVTGMEKVIASLSDMANILKLLPGSATGQKITTYTSFLGGRSETNSSQQRYVVIVDNNRSEMMNGINRQMLSCIHCGACLNVCPVFQRGGGHAYGSIYPGPMGIVLSPGLLGYDKAPYHPFACSLCGKCDEVCPVKIPLTDLILNSRNLRVIQKGRSAEKLLWQGWVFISVHKHLLGFIRWIGKFLPFQLNWGNKLRKLPRLAHTPFIKK